MGIEEVKEDQEALLPNNPEIVNEVEVRENLDSNEEQIEKQKLRDAIKFLTEVRYGQNRLLSWLSSTDMEEIPLDGFTSTDLIEQELKRLEEDSGKKKAVMAQMSEEVGSQVNEYLNSSDLNLEQLNKILLSIKLLQERYNDSYVKLESIRQAVGDLTTKFRKVQLAESGYESIEDLHVAESRKSNEIFDTRHELNVKTGNLFFLIGDLLKPVIGKKREIPVLRDKIQSLMNDSQQISDLNTARQPFAYVPNMDSERRLIGDNFSRLSRSVYEKLVSEIEEKLIEIETDAPVDVQLSKEEMDQLDVAFAERLVADSDEVDEELKNEVVAILSQAYATDFRPSYYYSKDMPREESTAMASRAEEMKNKVSELERRLRAHHVDQCYDIADKIHTVGRPEKAADEEFKKFSMLVANFDRLLEFSEVFETYEIDLEQAEEVAFEVLGYDHYKEMQDRIKKLRSFIGSEETGKFINNLEGEIDTEKWAIFANEPMIIEHFGQDQLDSVEKFLAERSLKRFLDLQDQNEDSRLKPGRNLFAFHEPKIVPYTILNAYNFNYQGIHPFLGRSSKGDSGENNDLVRYVLSFSDSDLEKLSEENIPGLMELFKIIKTRPNDFRNWTSANSENETGDGAALVQEKLDQILVHMLKSVNAQELPFYMSVIGRMENVPDEAYEVIRTMDFDPEIADMLTARIGKCETKAMDMLTGYLIDDRENHELILDKIAHASTDLRTAVIEDLSGEERLKFDDSLQKMLEEAINYNDELNPKQLNHLLMGFNALGSDSRVCREYLQSKEFRTRLSEVKSSNPVIVRLLFKRFVEFDDINCRDLLTELANDPTNSETERKRISKFMNDQLKTPQIIREYSSGKNDLYKKSVDEVIQWLQKGGNVSRQAAEIFENYASEFAKGDLSPEGLSQLQNEILPLMLSSDDPEIGHYALQIAGYLDINLEDKAERITNIYSKKSSNGTWSHNRSLASIADESVIYSGQQVCQIVGSIDANDLLDGVQRYLVYKFLDQGFRLEDDGAKLSVLMEVFLAGKHWQSKIQLYDQPLNEQSWREYLGAYLQIEETEKFDPATLERVTEMFSHEENKAFILEKFQKLYATTLSELSEGRVPFSANLLSELIKSNGGAGPLKYVEAMSNLIYQLKNTWRKESTADRSRSEILQLLQNQEERFVKEKWLEDEKAAFYNISADIVQASPALYSNFGEVIAQLSPKEMKEFNSELLPFYQAQLVVIQKENSFGQIEYNARELVQIRHTLENILASRSQGLPSTEVFQAQKNEIIENMKSNFKQRFGLLKIPDQMDREKIRSMQDIIRYMGNLNDRDTGKERLLSFFLGLMINDQWKTFRENGEIDPSEYFEGDNLTEIQNYLSDRKSSNPITAENLGIGEERLSEFQEILQDETISQMIGNVETIDVKLGNITRAIEDLKDEDAYPEEKDKQTLRLYQTYDKMVGSTLAKTFQELTGKNPEFSSEERQVQQELKNIFSITDWTPEQVKQIQDQTRSINLIVRSIKNIERMGINESIAELQRRLQPSEEVVSIFRKLGEEFTVHSGALALSQDLSYLENIIVKSDDKLDQSDHMVLQNYLNSIRDQMATMDQSLSQIQNQLGQIRQSIGSSHNEILSQRLDEIDHLISSKQNSIEIISRATNNMNLIVENMRQCLGCMSKECNNDTNLTFGDSGKFYLMSQSERQEGSIADEIVLLAPITLDDGTKQMTFMMDGLYGLKSSDVLFGHINCLMKKVRQIKEKFPEAKISIFVTDSAIGSAGMAADVLAEKLSDMEQKPNISMVEKATVDIVRSASGDHYIEVGGGSGARGVGPRILDGILVN
ncbi:TPA: hypothetical protein DD449_02395 [Candidatus Berkelbacteria bacterium]|uniref:Uncharacterized protein n=1 Tax=Berkelbacteria bacterium GW2011_GWE1_39_12 TaxID=1618337 RepID=A0A0G4B268_9BACT|nr:MAG: hypothetical protein UT28_C0001G0119 [Berkelbacteria bacterium GW2011_GWE1_39_12]HBO60506.1 hypothetical protein [Candidatus Berkelbacteria bacterium]